MINFNRYLLENGLKVLVNEDFITPLVTVNILYDVGSRDEDPGHTGLAHLFEHLMFSGSGNIPDYDTPLQIAGGENNAFTNSDVTSYYLTIPSENIETGLWLESDRMLGLDFSEKNMEIQKKVVAEEFKQRYLNQPYGDAMHKLRAAAFRVHPYRWPAIGLKLSHITSVNLELISDFYYSHYGPNNAILTFSGNIKHERALSLSEKWFGDIPRRTISPRVLPMEKEQSEPVYLTVEKNVPADLLYKAWHVCPRRHKDFYTLDLLTDLLAGGESGRLYNSLVRDKKLFSDINAYLTGELDPGLLIITGKVMTGIDMLHAEGEILKMVKELTEKLPPENEMEKVRNRFEAATVMSNSAIMGKALSLSMFELLGDAAMINSEVRSYRKVSRKDVVEAAGRYLTPANCTTLYYKSRKGAK